MKEIRNYGLIGYPLSHSYSAKLFAAKFKLEGIQAKYDLYPIENIHLLPTLIRDHHLCGLNVTIPYKEQVVPYLDSIEGAAVDIGAVNVIKIDWKHPDRIRLIGYNSDAAGFMLAYGDMLKNAGKNALVLGTGGAAKAVSYALRELGFDVTFVSRTPGPNRITYNEATKEVVAENHAIVNCTPLGMASHEQGLPPICYDGLSRRHVCIDLIYNPPVTEFRHACALFGAETAGGYPMLKAQAEEAWKIWNA